MDVASGEPLYQILGKINNKDIASLTILPSFQRKLNNLMWLDLLSLQLDRQDYKTINAFFGINVEDGCAKIIGIQGIDNDQSFGILGDNCFSNKEELENFFNRSAMGYEKTSGKCEWLPMFKYIDSSLFDKFLSIKDEEIEICLNGILEEEQIDDTKSRLRKIKEHIVSKNIRKLDEDAWNEETLCALKDSMSDVSFHKVYILDKLIEKARLKFFDLKLSNS